MSDKPEEQPHYHPISADPEWGWSDTVARMPPPRPWLFLPGDRVLCLINETIVAGTVQQIRIPGPLHEDQIVQVFMDEAQPGQITAMLWFNPDQVERITPTGSPGSITDPQ